MNGLYDSGVEGLSYDEIKKWLGDYISESIRKTLEHLAIEYSLPFRIPIDKYNPLEIGNSLPMSLSGSFRSLYNYTLRAYYMLRKTTPGWPIEFIIAAAQYSVDYRTREMPEIGEFRALALTLLYTFTVATALLKLLRCDKTWTLRIRTDEGVVNTVGCVFGIYTGKLWLERIIT